MKKKRFRSQVITRWVTSGFFLLFINFAYSQESLPLKIILDSLEHRHRVIFSYGDEQVIGKTSSFPGKATNLEDSLSQISEKTGLSFERLNDRYIIVRDRSEITFCGYLIDKTSGEPIEFAIITSLSSSVSESSGSDGHFNITLTASQESITVSHLSYADTLLETLEIKKCDTIYLNPSISELEEVYVSNYLVHGLDRTPFGAFVVNTKALQVLPGLSEPDVLHTLQVLPGIQSPTESVSDLNIRGGTNDQNLVLWDGIRMFQSGHFFGLITAFNPYFTDEVSLIKNGSSAVYGESISGILDIQSSNEIANKFSGGGGLNWLSGDLFMNVPISSGVSLSIAGRRSMADIIRTPTYRSYFNRAFSNTDVNASASDEEEDFQFYDVSAKLKMQLDERNSVNLSMIRIYNDLRFREEGLVNNELETRESSLTQQSLGLGIEYSREWQTKLISNFKAYLSSYQLHSLNNDITNNQRLIQENDVLDVGIQFNLVAKINDKVSWVNGIQFEETGITNLEDINNPNFRRKVKNVLTRYIGFSELSVFANEAKTNLRVGIRSSYFDQLKEFITEPRLVFRQEIMPSISFELSGEFRNQTTSQIIDLQTDFLGIEKRRWVLANNLDIPIIKSKQASVGLHYNKNELLISGEGYYKIGEGIITSGQAFQNQFEIIRSTGTYDTYGGEFLIRKKFDKYSVWGSYALAWNWFKFPMLTTKTFPNNLDVRHNINVGNRLLINQFELSTGVYWHTGIPFTPYNPEMPTVDTEIQYLSPNSKRLRSYMRLDLSGKYTFKLGDYASGQVGFSLWNISDQLNSLRLFYQLDTDGKVVQFNQSGLRFTPNIVLRIKI